MARRRGGPRRRGDERRPAEGRRAEAHDLLFIHRASVCEPIAVEVDRPLAFRPRLVGFWRGEEFHLIARVVDTRREHDVTYHRVLTDRGAFELRHIRWMNPLTLRLRRRWELCAELDAVAVTRVR